MKIKTLFAALLISVSITKAQTIVSRGMYEAETYSTDGKILTIQTSTTNPLGRASYGVGYSNYSYPNPTGNPVTTTSLITSRDLVTNNHFAWQYFFSDPSSPASSNNRMNSICENDISSFAVTGCVSNEFINNVKGEILFAIIDKNTGTPAIAKSINIAGVFPAGSTIFIEDVGQKIIHSGDYFYITGSTKVLPKGNVLFFVLKIDAGGNVVWCNSYDVYTSSPNERDSYGNDLVVVNSKIYVIGNTKGKTGASFSVGFNHGFLAEIDESSGGLLNFNTYDYNRKNSQFTSFVYDVQTDNFTICGFMDVTPSTTISHPLLIQIARNTLTVNWSNGYEFVLPTVAPEHSDFSDIFLFRDVFKIVGTYNDPLSATNTHHIITSTVDNSGINIHSDIHGGYGPSGNIQEARGVAIDMLHTSYGDPIDVSTLYCHTNSMTGTMENIFPMSNNTFEYCTTEMITPEVTQYPFNVQNHFWSTTPNFSVKDLIYSVSGASWNHLCMTANTFGEEGTTNQERAKLSNKINVELTALDYNNNIQVDLGTEKNDNYKMVLFDISGREVFSKMVSDGSVSLNLNGLSKGIYLLTTYDKNNIAVKCNKVIY